MVPRKVILHGSVVAFEQGEDVSGVLLRGVSGAGKSDIAFRLIEEMKAHLVSDDQVEMTRRDNVLFAGCIESIRGLLEIRGLGVVKYPSRASVLIRLVIDLTPREAVPRLPEWTETEILGVNVPCLQLHAFDCSTPRKILKAMEIVSTPALLVE